MLYLMHQHHTTPHMITTHLLSHRPGPVTKGAEAPAHGTQKPHAAAAVCAVKASMLFDTAITTMTELSCLQTVQPSFLELRPESPSPQPSTPPLTMPTSGNINPMASSNANRTLNPCACRALAMLPSHLNPVRVCSNLNPSTAAMAPRAVELTADASMTHWLAGVCACRTSGSESPVTAQHTYVGATEPSGAR